MGKKKKPSTPQSKTKDGRLSIDSDAPSSQPQHATRQVRDLLSVRLASNAIKQRSNEIYKPTIWMHESDMLAIDVLAGESVIVLAYKRLEDASETADATDSNRIVGAAICKVEASRSGLKDSLSQGKVQMGPSSILEVLLPQDNQSTLEGASYQSPSSKIPLTPARMTTLSPMTPSSSSSRFSFKTGGGGDQLYSSPVASPSPGKLTTPSKKVAPQYLLYLVPVDSQLGRKLHQKFVRIADSIQVQVLDESVKIKGCESIVKRLVLAHCVGRHLQKQEKFTISFRGRPLSLLVAACEPVDDTKGLEECMETLQVNDDEEKNETSHHDLEIAEIEHALEPSARDNCLMKVSYATTICLSSEANSTDISNRSLEAIPERHVAGLSSTLDEVRSFLMTHIDYPELFEGTLKPPKGILLHGSSGTGKTSLAKQIAVELQSHYIVEFINCVSLQSKTSIVGEAERELSRLFHFGSGKNLKPKLLIMDDIHLICPKRGGYSPGTDRLAATLLSLVDGVDSGKSKIILLAITTNPSLLDPALRRPGRLDTEVEVPLPDEPATRAEILRFQLDRIGANSPSLSDGEWSDLGKLAKGFNGADCMLAVKEAARFAILRQAPTIADSHQHASELVVSVDDLRSGIKATKPSAIKSITVEIPQVKWTDIGGMDEVKRQLRDAIELPLTHADTLSRLGVPAPRGILLYGPPGCSKTLMARALATEGQMNFLAVKGPELLSKWLGESERALASLFRRARMASPSCIFFDECDSIAVKRGSSDSASSSRLLSQLLTELDGVNHTATDGRKQRVVVIGATNRPDLLDPALTRPGRIDRMIYVGVPDYESRRQIFSLSLRSRACSDDIDIDALAHESVSGGFSGAEVVAICRDAALLALEEADDLMAEHLPVLEMKHLLSAAKDTKKQITPEMLEFYTSFRRSRDTFGVESFS
ncbi:hypothetical protein MPSEU_000826700 [Mayamaea pseudoterrestris]|nr:hypothetical protein MPSEU_000826700 [Mayamaea pseudoterrestris]